MLTRRHLAVLTVAALAAAAPIATASAAVTPAAPAPAAAGWVLSLAGPATPPALAGDNVSATLQTGTTLRLLDAGSGLGLTCKASAWKGVVTSNPTLPGIAAIQVLSLTISLCTDTNTNVTGLTSVVVTGLPEPLTVNGTSFALTFPLSASTPLTITENVLAGSTPIACVYHAGPPPTTGMTAYGMLPWTFTNQPFILVSGVMGPCGATTSDLFSASYLPVNDNTPTTQPIFVN